MLINFSAMNRLTVCWQRGLATSFVKSVFEFKICRIGPKGQHDQSPIVTLTVHCGDELKESVGLL